MFLMSYRLGLLTRPHCCCECRLAFLFIYFFFLIESYSVVLRDGRCDAGCTETIFLPPAWRRRFKRCFPNNLNLQNVEARQKKTKEKNCLFFTWKLASFTSLIKNAPSWERSLKTAGYYSDLISLPFLLLCLVTVLRSSAADSPQINGGTCCMGEICR